LVVSSDCGCWWDFKDSSLGDVGGGGNVTDVAAARGNTDSGVSSRVGGSGSCQRFTSSTSDGGSKDGAIGFSVSDNTSNN